MVTQQFHRIWFSRDETDTIPAAFETFWDSFSQLHPGYEMNTWTDEQDMRNWLINGDLWDKVNPLAGRTDLVRYELVARRGGAYVDTDVEPLRTWGHLFLLDKPFIGWESTDRLCPTVIGGPAGHPALKFLVEKLPEWVAQHEDEKDPVIQTGPEFITWAWWNRADVIRLPMHVFYPYGPTEKRIVRDRKFHPEALAVHHWAKGWG